MQYHVIKKLNVGQNSTESKSIEIWVNLNCFFLVIGLGIYNKTAFQIIYLAYMACQHVGSFYAVIEALYVNRFAFV